VKRAVANDGPRMKRIRPAPMGRAYRYVRRISHIEIALAERNRNGNANVATVVGAEQKSAKTPSKAAGKKPAKKKTGGKKKKTAGAR
jgi:large subunit ribosomal protein L22